MVRKDGRAKTERWKAALGVIKKARAEGRRGPSNLEFVVAGVQTSSVLVSRMLGEMRDAGLIAMTGKTSLREITVVEKPAPGALDRTAPAVPSAGVVRHGVFSIPRSAETDAAALALIRRHRDDPEGRPNAEDFVMAGVIRHINSVSGCLRDMADRGLVRYSGAGRNRRYEILEADAPVAAPRVREPAGLTSEDLRAMTRAALVEARIVGRAEDVAFPDEVRLRRRAWA